MSDTLFDFPALRPIVRTETVARVVADGHEAEDTTIQQQFDRFHAANPWVYDLLASLARDLIDRGARKIGVGMLFEVVRWQYQRTTNGDTFKLNNNYRSRYARLLMEREPDLAGIFEIRELHS